MELILPLATCHCTSHCVMMLLFILANKFSLSLSLSIMYFVYDVYNNNNNNNWQYKIGDILSRIGFSRYIAGIDNTFLIMFWLEMSIL